MKQGAPIFVKVDEYKEILDVLEMVKAKIKEIKGTLDNLNSFREQEDSELQIWNSTMEDVQAKIDAIDRVMYEPEQQW